MNVTVYVADMNSYSKRQKRAGQDRNAFIWIPLLVCLVGLASISAHAIPTPRLLIQQPANQKVVVGVDLFDQSVLAEKEKEDAFDKWFNK
jgi:hypothetical protein